jgi:hypothetical protein
MQYSIVQNHEKERLLCGGRVFMEARPANLPGSLRKDPSPFTKKVANGLRAQIG